MTLLTEKQTQLSKTTIEQQRSKARKTVELSEPQAQAHTLTHSPIVYDFE